MLVPSQTDRGVRWLSNFSDDERETAHILLDSLRIASSDEMRVGVQALLLAQRFDSPAVLIPVRSMEDLRSETGAVSRAAEDRLVAYEDFSPGSPLEVTPGSEGFIGNLIRDLTRSTLGQGGHWVHPSASLDDMKNSRCRTLVFVSDYVGSGDQVARFIGAFLRNPRIRSWRSFGWITIAAVSFAQSRSAAPVLDALADRVHTCEPARSLFTVGWDDATREGIEALCRRYASRKHSREALGYRESGGLFVSSVSSVSNNLPWILRRNDHRWEPFFRGRVFPHDLLAQVGGYTPDSDLAAVVQATGQARLARALRSDRHAGASTPILAILALLYERAGQSEVELAHLTGLPVQKVGQVLTFLQSGSLLNDQRRVTARGVRELRASRRLRRGVSDSIPSARAEPYYPRQLR